MTTRVPRALGIVLLAPTLTACLDAEAVDTTVDAASGPVSCIEVIDDQVAHAFGWPTQRLGGKVVAEDSVCVWRLSSFGEISARSVEGAGSATDRFDDACAGAAEVGPLDERMKAEIAGGGRACAVGLDPEEQTGTAVVVLRTTDDVVLDLRVETEAPLGPDELRAGFRELARQAQQEW
jgi:hypothetical protein